MQWLLHDHGTYAKKLKKAVRELIPKERSISFRKIAYLFCGTAFMAQNTEACSLGLFREEFPELSDLDEMRLCRIKAWTSQRPISSAASLALRC